MPRVRVPARQARARGICGARTRAGRYCQLKAGQGTTHPGIGACMHHGGNLKASQKGAIKREAVEFMGAPLDINPLDAIIWCIRITSGEIEWLTSEIAKVPEEHWVEHTIAGKQLNVMQRARADAQDRLVRYAQIAINLGLAERAIRLAEQFGTTIAKFVQGIYDDMELTIEQKKRWPIVIRKHLILMEGGRVIETGDKKRPLMELTAGFPGRRNGDEAED